MMNTRIFLCLWVSMLFPILLFSQDEYALRWGSNMEGKYSSLSYKVITAYDNYGYYIIGQTKKNNAISYYSLAGNLKTTNPLSLSKGKLKLESTNVCHTSGGTYLISTYNNVSAGKSLIYASEMSNGKIKEEKLVHEYAYAKGSVFGIFKSIAVTVMEDKDYSGMAMSKDSNYVVFINSLSALDKSTEKLIITVLDKNMNILWTSSQEFDHLDKDLRVVNFAVSNTGEVYIYATMKLAKGVTSGKDGHNIFRVTKNELKAYPIKFDWKIDYQNNFFFVSENDEVKLIVLSYDDNSAIAEYGISYIEINPGSGQQKVITKPLDARILEIYEDNKKLDKPGKLFNYIHKEGHYFHENGDVSLVCLYRDFYYKGDKSYIRTKAFIIFRINSNGEIIKTEVVNMQIGARLDFPRINQSIINKNNQLYFLYINTKAMPGDSDDKDRTQVRLCVINEEGNSSLNKVMFVNKDYVKGQDFYVPYIFFRTKDRMHFAALNYNKYQTKMGSVLIE